MKESEVERRTAEVNGVEYEEVPTDEDSCEGCDGQDDEICWSLPDCSFAIWKRLDRS